MSKSGIPIGEDDLAAYADGCLTRERMPFVEAYLRDNPDIAWRLERDREIAGALRGALAAKAAEPVPPHLRVAAVERTISVRRARAWRSLAAALALFMVGAGSGWLLKGEMAPIRQIVMPASVVAEAANAHRTFVVEVAHPVEVDAGESRHLATWLTNRLGHPITVPDLSAVGFQLMGGRLLPAASGPAGQLMYDNAAGERLTIYIRSEARDGVSFRFAEVDGATAFYWIEDGLSYSVLAGLPRQDLFKAASLAFEAVSASPPAAH